MKNTDTPAQRVIDAFGGVTKTAKALNCGKSTVSCWGSRGGGLIPAQMQKRILAAASELDIELKPADLVATNELDES